jgi:hypothetical protein
MAIDLTKRTEHVGIILKKNNIEQPPKCRVGLCLDISGSMQHLYNKGVVQDTVDRLLAIAMKFDDNGEMDMWTFTNSSDRLKTATSSSYGSYVEKEILQNNKISKWGGTSYSPCFQDVVDFYYGDSKVEKPTSFMGKLFGGKKIEPTSNGSDAPAVCFFITDGCCNDEDRAARVLRDAAKNKVYWHMVGIGNPSEFSFLKKKADELDNVGFINMSTLDMTDDELYNQMITEEFITFVKTI